MKKRFISILLVAVMIVAMIPTITLPTAAAEEAEAKVNYMAYVTNPTFDGKNTNGEYDNAYTVPFNVALWSNVSKGNETMKVVYGDDAIYVLFESIDDVKNDADFIYFNFRVGTTFVGSTQHNRKDTTVDGYASKGGTVDVSESYDKYFKETDSQTGWTVEARFPVSELTANEQAEYAAGTLDVGFSAAYLDDWGSGQNKASQTHTDGYSRGAATAPRFTFAEKYEYEDATLRPIYFASNPILDGVNTSGEYDNAFNVPFTSIASGAKEPGPQSFRVIYSDDAIYFLVEIDDATDNAGSDFVYFHMRVGESFVGSKLSNRTTDLNEGWTTSKGAVTMNQSNNFKETYSDAGWTVEGRLPVADMTEADKAAFAAGTLDIAICCTYTEAWAYVYSTDASGSYSAMAEEKLAALPRMTLMSKDAAEDKTAIEMPFISDTVLDGINTNGEYDGADVIALNYSYWGGVSEAADKIRVTYSHDAVYVLIEANDDTENGTDDRLALMFSVGTSYVGSKEIYRTNSGAQLHNLGGTVTMGGTWDTPAKYFACHTDANGYTLEAKFPVEDMNEADKAAFAAGTLKVAVGGWIMNNWAITETRAGNYSTNNGNTATAFSTGTLVVCGFGEKGTNYVDEIVFDGVNTDREYNTATVITYPYGIWGYTPVGNETMKIVYTNEAIYVLVELVDTTPDVGTEDFHYLHISVGESFIGSKLSNKNSLDTDEDYVNVGGRVSLKNYQKDLFKESHTETGYTIEAKFPVALMTETDREAFNAGTLRVAFAGVHCDNWNVALSVNGIGYSSASAENLAAIPAIELAARNTEADLLGANLTLGENINVNYYASLSYADAKNAFVKFTYNGKTFEVDPVSATDKLDSYIFSFANLAPQCMGDNIVAELIINGKTVETKDEYSALQNCKNLLENEATPEKAKPLIYDLLAYGAAAQKYAGYKTDALVNAGYEELASGFNILPTATVTFDGANTNGEYNNAITVDIDNAIAEGSKLPSGYAGTSSGNVPTGSYYKVLLADDAIYVYVNIADMTASYYNKTADSDTDNGAYYYADQMSIIYSIGNSFIGKDWGYRHGTMGATNSGDGTLNSYPSTQKDNGADGWGYEIKFPVSGMTEADKAAYAAGTLSIEFNVVVADNSQQGWGFNGFIYSDNTTADAYTSISVIDKAVGAPNVEGAAFAAAGVYHANANKIYAKIAVKSNVNVEDLTVTIDGVKATIEATETAGIYIVYTEDVKVIDFDRVYNFVLSDGENTQTLAYSINAYSIVKAANGKTEATKEIAKAMYNYGVSAEAYVAG